MTTPEFTPEEVALHNKESDCWIIVHGKVYDVTKFLDSHPGGADIIMDEAGTDCTTQFEDTGHSQDARKDLLKYEIGTLKGGAAPAGKKKQAGSSSASHGGGGGDVAAEAMNPALVVAGVVLILAALYVLLNPGAQ